MRIILWLVNLYSDSILTISEIANNVHTADEPEQSNSSAEKSWVRDPLWNAIKMIGKR